MQAYKLIAGSSEQVAEFEKKISDAMEEGYLLEGQLVTAASPGAAVHLFQSMVFEEELYFDEDEEGEGEEEDE